MASIPNLIIGLVALGIVFGIIEWRWPALRGQKRLRPGLLTDVAWYAFTPTVGRLFTSGFVFVCVLLLAAVLGVSLTSDQLRGLAPRETRIGQQPLGLQLIELLLLADFLSYWQHRAFHHFERLWRIHAVHHSSTQLDWLSSVRVHPLNDAIGSAFVAAPLVLVGFSPLTVAAYTPLLTLYAIALHANVSWSLGPLRYVISSPTFHRWHHAAEPEAVDKNFAGLLPVWDLMFGTFYMPKDRLPRRFGVLNSDVPQSFLPQLLYPLRGRQRQLSSAS